MGERIGYQRCSSAQQSTARQLAGVQLDRIFEDHASGKNTDRPALTEMLSYARSGDSIVCHSFDRLGRDLQDLQRLISDMTRRGIRVEFVKEGLTFDGEGDSPMSQLLLGVLGAFSQFERSLILERQREGVALAKQRGAYKGRKPVLNVAQVATIRERLAAGEKKTVLARELGISRQALYDHLAVTAEQ